MVLFFFFLLISWVVLLFVASSFAYPFFLAPSAASFFLVIPFNHPQFTIPGCFSVLFVAWLWFDSPAAIGGCSFDWLRMSLPRERQLLIGLAVVVAVGVAAFVFSQVRTTQQQQQQHEVGGNKDDDMLL